MDEPPNPMTSSWELLDERETEIDGCSSMPDELLGLVQWHLEPRDLFKTAQACRRWKRLSDNHGGWMDLLRDYGGGVSVEIAFVDDSDDIMDGSGGAGPAWHRSGEALVEMDDLAGAGSCQKTNDSSSRPDHDGDGTPSSSSEWENIDPPSKMAALSPHDCKLMYHALVWRHHDASESETSTSSSLWDTVAIVPGSKAEAPPATLSTLSMVSAGRSVMKITVAGGCVLAGASTICSVLPWWQQPMARWVMRSYAIEWCWLTIAGSSFWSARSEKNQASTTEKVAAATGGGAAAYLGTLAFVTIL